MNCELQNVDTQYVERHTIRLSAISYHIMSECNVYVFLHW